MLVQEERDRARPANLGGEVCVCVEDSATSKPRGGMCYSRRSWRRAAAIERVRWRTGGGASWARACIRVHPACMLSTVQWAKVRVFKREQGREGPYAQDIAESQPRIRCNRARSAWGKNLQDRACRLCSATLRRPLARGLLSCALLPTLLICFG